MSPPQQPPPALMTVPQREFGSNVNHNKQRLAEKVSIVGLGCSSFSSFFSSSKESDDDVDDVEEENGWSADTLREDHPRVLEWKETIRYAILTAGMTVLDTAPWYGHGTSERVVGWALAELTATSTTTTTTTSFATATALFDRKSLTINTKVGRYEADPAKQFDFSKAATMQSVERSLKRMQCDYIDVLQLHDPEFSPSLDILLSETIPAMRLCQEKGQCRALGMTGYPLHVQHQILEESLAVFGQNVWDQALTYGHYNLHDTSLWDDPIGRLSSSFGDYCCDCNLLLVAAAPLSMGLLVNGGTLPEWHPAPKELQQASREAARICRKRGVDIATLAIAFALSNPNIPCTLLGMRNVDEAKTAHRLANRFHNVPPDLASSQTIDVLQFVLDESEFEAYKVLADRTQGPFASVWSTRSHQWDGVQEARKFWKQLDCQCDVNWQSEQS